MPAPQLADKEKRQILRYCAYPKFAAAALVMAFASAVLVLPLEMVDDLVFHNKGFDPAGLYTALAFVVLNLAVFCYCTLSPKFGMRGERWRSLQERLRVPQAEADRSAQVAGVLAAQAAGTRPRLPAPWARSPPRRTSSRRSPATRKPWRRPTGCPCPTRRSSSSPLSPFRSP